MRGDQNADDCLSQGHWQPAPVVGGSTLFPGFGDRLLNDVRRLAPKDTKIRITAPPERLNATWIGGSILASLATFKTMWIRKDEYEEYGASVVERKAL